MVFLHLIFFTWGIYTSVQVFFKLFYEEYLPLCELTKMVFSTIENYLYLKNMHLSASVIQFFSMKNIYPCPRWLKWCFLHLKMLSTNRIFTSLRVFFILFSIKNIYLCVSWLKWCFLHSKMFSTWIIYTSVRVDWNDVFYNQNYFISQKYIPLCECFSIFFNEEYLPLCKVT